MAKKQEEIAEKQEKYEYAEENRKKQEKQELDAPTLRMSRNDPLINYIKNTQQTRCMGMLQVVLPQFDFKSRVFLAISDCLRYLA